MNELADLLRQRIRRDGPIGIDIFMAEALGHPEHGYYMHRDPFGRAGDFITAPETSQMFGELIGLWCIDTWQRMGAPADCLLIELGPGRGSLMSDALRAMAAVPGVRGSFNVHLVETSPHLRELQSKLIGNGRATWHSGIDQVPAGHPAFIIANEFFDALPVRQFVATEKGWRERLIDADDDIFRPILGNEDGPSQDLPDVAPPGRILELSPARADMMASIAERIAGDGGAALIVDFAGNGDTLQAVRGHEQVDRFADPGKADLAAAVDFASLAVIAAKTGALAHGPVGQGLFLMRLGIDQRADALLRAASADQDAAIRTGYQRLVGDQAMGTLYQALAVCHPDLPPPAGFEEDP